MKKIALLTVVILSYAGLCAGAATPARIRIILDTDIGSDIDDAFALALIVKSPEFELLGVTTVSGDTAARARIAAKMLWEAGGKWRQVPVVAGLPGPKQDINQAPWADAFGAPSILHETAVHFLGREFHQRPGQITLIAIGALTNVAALFKANPQVVSEIKRISMMGGSIARGYKPGSKPDAEWNVKSDPDAAQKVFASGIPILMAPLDVTAMLKLNVELRARVFNRKTPLTDSLAVLYRLWNRETPTLFDPMAAALVLDPGLCETKNLAIDVDSQGYTRVVNRKPPNATVGLSTNPDKFFDFCLARITGIT